MRFMKGCESCGATERWTGGDCDGEGLCGVVGIAVNGVVVVCCIVAGYGII